MVVRVAERAQAAGAARVVVATDDERIAPRSKRTAFDRLRMTRADHATGTDRIAEAAQLLGPPTTPSWSTSRATSRSSRRR